MVFETVAASLLSAMAIIVSVAQFMTTSKQTKILDLQTKIAEAQALPNFEVNISQQLNDATGKFDDNLLVIRNEGGPVHDFEAHSAYFLRIKADVQGIGFREVEIPVNGYFNTRFVSAASKGVLVTMVGQHNNALYSNLVRATRDMATAKKWTFAVVEEKIFVRFRYLDVLERRHEDYYVVSSVGGGSRISESTGKAEFAKFEHILPLELTKLSAEQLLTIMSNAAASKSRN